MQLERLAPALGPFDVVNAAPVEISDLVYDTRAVTPGTLFFGVRATRITAQAGVALESGADAAASDRQAPRRNVKGGARFKAAAADREVRTVAGHAARPRGQGRRRPVPRPN